MLQRRPVDADVADGPGVLVNGLDLNYIDTHGKAPLPEEIGGSRTRSRCVAALRAVHPRGGEGRAAASSAAESKGQGEARSSAVAFARLKLASRLVAALAFHVVNFDPSKVEVWVGPFCGHFHLVPAHGALSATGWFGELGLKFQRAFERRDPCFQF